MRLIGIGTSAVLAAAAVAAVAVGVKSLPDIQRYLRMRQM